MDTIKDRQRLEGLHESGRAPWRHVGDVRDASRRGLMLALSTCAAASRVRRVLAIGCHADDIEIGCGGTLLALVRSRPDLEVTWVVLGAEGDREAEARASAEAFLARAGSRRGRRPRVPGRLHALQRRRGEGGLRGSEARRSAISCSRTRATTSTRTTGSPASSRGTRSAIT